MHDLTLLVSPLSREIAIDVVVVSFAGHKGPVQIPGPQADTHTSTMTPYRGKGQAGLGSKVRLRGFQSEREKKMRIL